MCVCPAGEEAQAEGMTTLLLPLLVPAGRH